MSYADARLGEIVNGYKCIKPDKGKGWATFKLDNSQEWTEQQQLEWKQQNERLRNQQAKNDEERRERSLKAEDRDPQYQKIFSQLTLHPDDKADLVRRGFTNEQIELSGFKSVERYQDLQSRFSNLLPGVTSDGRKLIVPNAGYLCPIRNIDGLIVGCQIRLRALPTGESNRYRWLSSQVHTLHFYPEGSLKGELPLAIFKPEGESEGIALAEGTGAKPFLVSQRLNKIVIGAAGGQWASSPLTLRNSLERLAQEIGKIKPITLYPDAGDVRNPSVMKRWKQVTSLLQKWGWFVRFAWWGQIDKTHLDIDELTDFNIIEYITSESFFEIARVNSTESSTKKHIKKVIPKLEQKLVKGKKHQPQIQQYSLEETEIEAGWRQWKQLKKLTPQSKINVQFFNFNNLETGTITGVKSGTGTGKTRALIRAINSLDDYGCVSIGYRNSILVQFCQNQDLKGWYHLQKDLKDTVEECLIADPNSKIACCIDSLIHFRPEDFEGKILILDETESIIKHLFSSNTTVGLFREKIKDRLLEAIERADRVICLDGHLKDITMQYLSTGSKKLVTVENLYQGNKGKVKFYRGTKNEEGNLNSRDFSPINRAILSNPNPIVFASDSKGKVQSYDRLLKEKGRNTLRLDGDTSSKPWVEEFLKNPRDYIYKHKIDAFLYSPTGEAGLDLDIKNYFTDAYILFTGVIVTDAQLQLIARLRDANITIHIHCVSKGLPSESVSKSPFPEKLREALKEYTWDCATASLRGLDKEQLALDLVKELIDESDDNHFEHELQLNALDNFERENLRECLYEGLQESGYKVQDVYEEKSSVESLSIKQRELKEEIAEVVFSVPLINESEVNEIKRKYNPSLEEKAQVSKHRLFKRLPGIQDATYIEQVEVKVPVTQVQVTEVADSSSTVSPGADLEQANASEKSAVFEGDQTGTSQIEQEIEESHLPQDSLIKNQEGATSQDETQYITEIRSIEKPVVSPELMKRLLKDDPGLIARLELRWLLEHPEEAKRLQQEKWHRKLDLFTDESGIDTPKRMSLSHYKSRYLKLFTLMEMGINYFLKEGASWTTETPEVQDFFKKGKNPKNARNIGIKVGEDSPCAYVGKALRAVGYKTKYSGNKKRAYSIAPADEIIKALYSSVSSRLEIEIAGKSAELDWSILERNRLVEEAEIPIEHEFQKSHLPQDSLIKNQEGATTTRSVSDDARFCLQALADLETPGHPTISNHDQLTTLFTAVEMRGENCSEKLSINFWQRIAEAISLVSQSLQRLYESVADSISTYPILS
jgi:hypothetical protein